jgi:hypothetical protein
MINDLLAITNLDSFYSEGNIIPLEIRAQIQTPRILELKLLLKIDALSS